MKKVLLLLCVLFQIEHISALNVIIIESQSANVGHVMDTQWYNLLISLGHSASIRPQTTLDNTLFFTNTDILIVSSGVITLPSNRVMTIQQYLQSGGKVYLQSEYLPSYTTNQAFQSIVSAMGGTFSWNGTSSGNLIPMNSFGTLSATPNAVNPLNFFWYGTYGNGLNSIEAFLGYNALYYGFIFCCPASAGRMITTSDQDWVRVGDSTDLKLMKNIIYNLSLAVYTCPSASLPITLLSFNATVVTGGVSLNWSTASEVNNDYFTVERSADAISFQEILKVDGAGTSTHTLNYSALDASPLPGISYYRLRQKDFNGQSTTSDIVAVNISDHGNLLIIPNPANSFVNIFLTENVSGEHTIEIIDSKGAVVLKTTENFSDKKYYTFPLENYNRGIYLIRLTDTEGTSQTTRFVVN